MSVAVTRPSHPSTARPARARSVVAALNYLTPCEERPISYVSAPPDGTPWETGVYEAIAVPILDARGLVPPPSIDGAGFELWDAPSEVGDFLDEELVKAVYYREAAELALAATGAHRAYVFDHVVRRRERDRKAVTFGRKDIDGRPAVNGRIHNDYTEASGRRRLLMELASADEAMRVRRHAIVNIWRSIAGPVRDTPLAVCDARSIAVGDLVAGELRYPGRTGEIYHARYSDRHQWYYYSEMDRHEALIFKQYDSLVSGVARFVPHAAFDLPEIPPGAQLRESVEVRCLVTYE